MTKRDLVERIAHKTGLIQNDVAAVVQKLLGDIADEIVAEHTVELRDFGIFVVVIRKSRVGRNPHRPEEIVVMPDRNQVKFRVGKELNARVLQLNTARLSGD
jgi:nucleoid DNA-binding protein